MRGIRIKFRTIGTRKPSDVAREFDRGKPHSEADAKIRNLVFACITDRCDLAFYTALAKAARHPNRVHFFQPLQTILLDAFRINVMNIELGARMDSGVDESFR